MSINSSDNSWDHDSHVVTELDGAIFFLNFQRVFQQSFTFTLFYPMWCLVCDWSSLQRLMLKVIAIDLLSPHWYDISLLSPI